MAPDRFLFPNTLVAHMLLPSRAVRALLLAVALPVVPAILPAQITVHGSTVQEREAGAGTPYEGTVVVHNNGATAHGVRLYVTDYRFFADGQSLFDAPGAHPRSNAAWLTVSPSRVTVPAGETMTVHYRVDVPPSTADSLQGTYWSMLMVEGEEPAADDSPAAAGRLTTRTTVRHGVQIVTHVARTGAPRVDFAAPAAHTAPDGSRTLDVDLANVGDRASRLELSLELYDAQGRAAGTFRSSRGLVYPGCSIRQHFALGTLPPGDYTALLVADGGSEAVFGAQYTLRF